MATKTMLEPVTWKRFTSDAIETYTGVVGEPIIDFRSSEPELRICDGVKEGGHPVGGGGMTGIAIPQIIAPINGASGVDASPIITATNFNGIKEDGSGDVHAASYWSFFSDANLTNQLHASGRDATRLTSYDLSDAGVSFTAGQQVFAKVEYEGESGTIVSSAAITFTVIAISAGATIDGDVVIGQHNGHWILVAPATKRAQRQWGSYGEDTNLPNITSAATPDPNNSAYNTEALVGRGTGKHPAAEYCRSMGYDLPNKEVLNMIFQNKAAIDAADTSGGANTLASLGSNWVWSSTETSSLNAWVQRLSDGNQNTSLKSYTDWVVPVRSISV